MQAATEFVPSVATAFTGNSEYFYHDATVVGAFAIRADGMIREAEWYRFMRRHWLKHRSECPIFASRWEKKRNVTYIERTLWFETGGLERQSVKENRLLERTEPLVVLGEPGMGKSRLLGKLAQDAGVDCFTARQIINRSDPSSLVRDRSLVIIDALDEVAARHDGDAVDRILEKLRMLDYPRFVLSCRVGDWRAATSTSAISEQYDVEPLQLHLAPLTREKQTLVLAQNRDTSDAERILSHFESFGLDFLGNPQTLELVARLPAGDPLPQNSTELFERAIDVLRVEHRNSSGRSEPAKDIVIDAAGAAFAGLILTGSDKISRHASANTADGEIQFGEADSLAGGHLEQAIGTRLFFGGDDSFSYWHRRIGEFLGAKWLAKRVDTRRERQRLLRIFQSHRSVPANLRGLHAWLARDTHLAPAVIDANPMGVLERFGSQRSFHYRFLEALMEPYVIGQSLSENIISEEILQEIIPLQIPDLFSTQWSDAHG